MNFRNPFQRFLSRTKPESSTTTSRDSQTGWEEVAALQTGSDEISFDELSQVPFAGGASGSFLAPKSDFGVRVADFIAKVPTNSDMRSPGGVLYDVA